MMNNAGRRDFAREFREFDFSVSHYEMPMFWRLADALASASGRIMARMEAVANEWHEKHPWRRVTFVGDDAFGAVGFYVDGRDVLETPDDPDMKSLVIASRWFNEAYDQLRLDLGATEIPPKPGAHPPKTRRRP